MSSAYISTEAFTVNPDHQPWRALAFPALLTPSLLTKIGIIYTQLEQEEKIFPMMPTSEWSPEWSLRYVQKCSKCWVKYSEQNFAATTPGYSMVNIAPSRWRFLRSFKPQASPVEGYNHCSKKKRKGENGKAKRKITKIEKPSWRSRSLSRPKTQNFDFSARPSQNVVKRDGKNTVLNKDKRKCFIDLRTANDCNTGWRKLPSVLEQKASEY